MSSTILNSINSLDYSLEVESDGNFGKFTDQLVYEVVKLSECDYDPETETFYYLCPCGDLFEIALEDLLKGNLISECPSCSLRIRIDLKPGDLDQFVNMKTV
ncbi:Diphthamide biosynthesis protein 3 [Theileria parva strain Muguga]|uniref:DPH-type MB domain-containing protein n=1 Tax=Theileria parva TaxID=5875 RepID=Q4MZL3_THEPA|nr:Diphthamide biosynthesis protein 3 [Theileria parva strain Muguga]EAN31248.1 Diphthamide biosynthesis protein 3 [Theileria parva strain Muguga]|eukprot:XP_763531.1 hypothetical protein [Theileria parva strain Muguga]